jgi:hypothetical protein
VIGPNASRNSNSNNTKESSDKVNQENNLWLENLKKNEEQRRKDSQWFSMQSGKNTQY